ncbi:MAG TPA: formylmethanofuran dehydrogenase subunit C [Methanosarcinales archaeon]|nr:formylmethanofuran dehydrogenase subunit C [Methanosarcinales archaeon]
MQTVTLTPKRNLSISVEAENITPDTFAGKSAGEIGAITAWEGNTQITLADIFDIAVDGSGDAAETKIVIDGDVPRVKRIGEAMTAGEIVVAGDCDMHCGALMSGGTITVEGNADGWVGREMKGGEIVVKGNAAYYAGGGYRGETCGMTGGKLVIEGDALDYLGEHLCGGEIIVKGNVRLLAGVLNRGGTITIEGDTALPGGEMKKGTIFVKGKVLEMLPSYRDEGTEEVDGVTYRKYVGDLSCNGEGVLYVSV